MENYKGMGPDPVAVTLHAWPWIHLSNSPHHNHGPDKSSHRRNDTQHTNSDHTDFSLLDEEALSAGTDVP